MVRSQDNLTIVASEIDFSNQQRISYQQAAGVIPAASWRSSAHYSLSAAFNYSLKNSVPYPPHNLFVTPQYLMMSTHLGSWAAGVKNLLSHAHWALWISMQFCKASRIFLPQLFGIPALHWQCENSSYGSDMPTGLAKVFYLPHTTMRQWLPCPPPA